MAQLTAVVFDAVDVRALARFWADALDWQAAEDGSAVRPPGGGPELRFTASERPRTGKNRVHLDLAGGADQQAEVARLLALGAVRADIGQGDVPWDVLADPEGNEFCVLPGNHGSEGTGLAAICLDAADPDTQERFWTAATGWPVADRAEWGVRLRDPAGTGPGLVMGPPAAEKTGRNRVRLLLTAEDLDAAADPEGNEFEVERPRPAADRSGTGKS